MLAFSILLSIFLQITSATRQCPIQFISEFETPFAPHAYKFLQSCMIAASVEDIRYLCQNTDPENTVINAVCSKTDDEINEEFENVFWMSTVAGKTCGVWKRNYRMTPIGLVNNFGKRISSKNQAEVECEQDVLSAIDTRFKEMAIRKRLMRVVETDVSEIVENLEFTLECIQKPSKINSLIYRRHFPEFIEEIVLYATFYSAAISFTPAVVSFFAGLYQYNGDVVVSGGTLMFMSIVLISLHSNRHLKMRRDGYRGNIVRSFSTWRDQAWSVPAYDLVHRNHLQISSGQEDS